MGNLFGTTQTAILPYTKLTLYHFNTDQIIQSFNLSEFRHIAQSRIVRLFYSRSVRLNMFDPLYTLDVESNIYIHPTCMDLDEIKQDKYHITCRLNEKQLLSISKIITGLLQIKIRFIETN